jgi:SAM-dependent methyltransferase
MRCACCEAKRVRQVASVEGVAYFQCKACSLVFADPELLARLDRGESIRAYDEAYWQYELPAARQRAGGAALARMAEVFYYCRIPITRFLDVGSGPGFFLDAVARWLPSRKHMFWAVEKFPPPVAERTRAANYVVGDVADLAGTGPFDAGLCMEVVEHLTPAMLGKLLDALAGVSSPQAAWLVNTGLADYVMHEDPGYLDPWRRGHVIAWSIPALRMLAAPRGFTVHPIGGKSWAFVLEFGPPAARREDIRHRVWTPVPANVQALCDPECGEVLKILGQETIRAYGGL